jgi:type IV pilus assembly protein PilY1
MKIIGYPRNCAILIAAILAWHGASAQAASYLELSQEPLFAGTNAPPNVLVAVDDSGSMDLETLFPTDDGFLFWNSDANGTADSSGTFYNSGDTYGYIFPFDQVQAGQSLTVPPTPSMAYVRSHEYNKSYFNPATTYEPWLEYDDSTATAALNDPEENAGVTNLTQTQAGTFDFRRGMSTGPTYTCVHVSLPFLTYTPSAQEIRNGACSGTFFGRYRLESSTDVVNAPARRQLTYFPATFYLKAGTSLPADYGYDASPITGGKGPQGEELEGYEIKPGNFEPTSKYDEAIANFANWFTYYRKRHLATRGGIVAAFDEIDDIRVGACTINNRRDLRTGSSNLTMLELNDSPTEPNQASPREQFYSSVFNIDYTSNRGTPNREALKYLGSQLEGNRSIITAPCQRNFAILFTDGFSDPSTGHNVGNVDGNYGAPFADSRENTIADIAMRYYKELNVPITSLLKVPEACKEDNPPLELDCETDLHMTTFGVTLNQSGTLFNTENQGNPYANPENWPRSKWPDVNSGGRSKKQIDDLWHATINTRGDLLNATTPKDIASKFTTALQRILGEQGSATSLSLNSSNLTGDSVGYQAGFTSGAWTGELKALPQLSNGDFDDPAWQASSALSDATSDNYRAPNDRVILTSKRSNCGNGNNNWTPAPFRFDSLKNGCKPLTQDEVNYLRGDRTKERANNGELRNRYSNILGDIVNSSPIYVGAPNRIRYPSDWNDLLRNGNERTIEDVAGPYTDFQNGGFAEAAEKRIPMVYVGANDGMLHGFNANTGEERLAYVPGSLTDELSQLTRPDYLHRYFVDGTPASGDVVINTGSGPQWRTVLVGGLGAGGRSVYALDVTNPGMFSESNPGQTVLWEFEDEELGNVIGQPSIVRLHNGRWAAVFGNGYNSERGSAQLFVVDIETGDLLRKIDTFARPGSAPDACELPGNNDPSCSNGSAAKVTVCHRGTTKEIPVSALDGHLGHGDLRGACGASDEDQINGLSEVFPVDLDGDFITDYIYAGDLYGNVWKFDLTSSSSDNWKVGLGGDALFTAVDDDGNRQPITSQPQVGVHPYGSRYGVMVYFGTGKYLESTDRDADTDAKNTFYGIWDLDVFTFNQASNGRPLFSTTLKSEIPRSRLLRQTITETIGSNGQTYRLVSDNPILYQTQDDKRGDTSHRGWYINLSENTGEMSVTNSRIEAGTIAFSTTIPNTETCAASGSGYFMLLDRRNGGRTDYPAFDLNGDDQLNVPNDTVSRNENGKDVNVGASGVLIKQGIPGAASHQQDKGNGKAFYIVPTSDGSVRTVATPPDPDRRRSWREIRR